MFPLSIPNHPPPLVFLNPETEDDKWRMKGFCDLLQEKQRKMYWHDCRIFLEPYFYGNTVNCLLAGPTECYLNQKWVVEGSYLDIPNSY
jgi:hypothetical protein